MGAEGEFVAVAGDQLGAELRTRDVADDFHVVERFYLLVGGERHGEKQFVVLAAVERAGAYVEIQLFGRHSCLVVDGQTVLVDAAAHARALTDVEQFAAQSVAHVDHGGGADAGCAQGENNVAARLGFEEPLEQVFAPGEVGGEVQGAACGFAFGGAELREVDALFALEQAESEIGGAEVSAHTNQVGVLCAVAAADVVGLCGAQCGEAEGEARERGAGVAPREIDFVLLARQTDAGVEFVDVFDGKALGERHAGEQLARGGVHGVEIGEVDHRGLVAQVAQGRVDEVEVDAFHEQVGGGEEHFAGFGAEHGAVVADAAEGMGVEGREGGGDAVDEPKFAQFGDLHGVETRKRGRWWLRTGHARGGGA